MVLKVHFPLTKSLESNTIALCFYNTDWIFLYEFYFSPSINDLKSLTKKFFHISRLIKSDWSESFSAWLSFYKNSSISF